MYDFKISDEPFARGYLNAESDSKYVRTGNGYLEAMKAVRISFDGDTGFPCLDFGNMACTSSWSDGQSPSLWLLSEKAEKYPENAEDYLYIAENMKSLDLGSHFSEFSENEWDITRSGSGWGGTWGGHAVPDLIDFARLGTIKMRERIALYRKKNPESDDFYEGLILTLSAIELLCDRILETARAEYEKSKEKKLLRIIEAFSYCPRLPARTFSHAVCVYVTVFSLDGIDSPGHFDLYMKDFWEGSDYSESIEALEDLWVFFHKTRTWNLCISGSDENWNDLTNSLTYEILRVARKYKFHTPNITMRCHRNTPEKLYREAAKTIATGIGMPTLYNDEAVCPALESLGIPPADAHRYVMNGCNQIDIQGKSHMGLEDGEVNLGLALKYALFDGFNPAHKKQVGKRTGQCEMLDTYEKFLGAVKEQIAFLSDGVCSMANKAQRIHAAYTSNPIRSMTIEGCIEKGLDYKNRGPLYGHGQVLCEGLPELIDSLANIKKFVYDEKKYSLSTVRDALERDYEGYEEMYLTFKNSGLNFGNDIEYVDSIAADVIDFYNSYLRTKRTERGGVYTGGCSPFNRAAFNGSCAGALPNGKRESESLYGDSIGATPGRDVKGPTALLNSCLSLDHTLPGSGFILNLKFDRTLFNTPAGTEGFIALWRTYFENGGQQLSVTVVSREDLLSAKERPEEYRNLIVRVGGFSEYFVNLSPELQDNVIARTDLYK
ncbi:MAG: hypothetical protein E7647_06030 [Ruminococcaceae bacterium]|nr:hypothetical protein [Oscillospiraceae bacterium]